MIDDAPAVGCRKATTRFAARNGAYPPFFLDDDPFSALSAPEVPHAAANLTSTTSQYRYHWSLSFPSQRQSTREQLQSQMRQLIVDPQVSRNTPNRATSGVTTDNDGSDSDSDDDSCASTAPCATVECALHLLVRRGSIDRPWHASAHGGTVYDSNRQAPLHKALAGRGLVLGGGGYSSPVI